MMFWTRLGSSVVLVVLGEKLQEQEQQWQIS